MKNGEISLRREILGDLVTGSRVLQLRGLQPMEYPRAVLGSGIPAPARNV